MSQIEAGQLEDIDGVDLLQDDGDTVVTDSTSGEQQPSSLVAPPQSVPATDRPKVHTEGGAGGVESLVAQRSERKEAAADGAESPTSPSGTDEGAKSAAPPGGGDGAVGGGGDTASATAAAQTKQEQRILEILEKPARARGGHEVQHLGEYLRSKAPKLFSDMPAEAVRTVARRATLRVARPNEVLFTQGEKGDKYYLILRGQVAIHIVTGNNGISNLNRATKEYGEHSTQHAERVEKVAARRAAARLKAERKMGGITSLLRGTDDAAAPGVESGSDDSDSETEADPAAAAEGERSRRASALGSGMSNVDSMVASEALKYPPLMFVAGGGGKQLPPGVAREQVVVVAEAHKRQEAISAAAQDDLYEKIAEQQAASMMKRAAKGLKGGSKAGSSNTDKELSVAMALASGLRTSKLVGTLSSAVTRGSMRPRDYKDSDFFQLLGRKLGYNNVHDGGSPMRRPMTVADTLLGNVVVKLPPGAGFGEIALLGAAQGMRPPPGQDELTPAQLAELEKLSRRNASAVCVGPKGFDPQLGRVVGNEEQETEDDAEARAAAGMDTPSSPKRGGGDGGVEGGQFSRDAMFGGHPEDDRDKKALLRGLTYLLVIDRETYLESLTEKARQELDVKLQYLRHGMGLPLFTDWPTRRLTTIAYALKQREFPLRSPLFTRGSRVRGVFFIIKGFVKVTAYAARSAPPAGLAKGLAASVKGMGSARKRVNQFALNTQRLPVDVVALGPGSVVGDLGPQGVLPDARHTTTAVADSSIVDAFFLPQHDFLNLVMRQTDTWVAARLAAEGQRRMQGQRAIMTGLGLSPDVLQSLTPSQLQAMQLAAEGGVGGVDPYLFKYGDGNEYWETLAGVGQNRNVKFNQEQKQGDSSMPVGLAPEESAKPSSGTQDSKPRRQRDALSSRIAQAKRAKRLAAQAATAKAARAAAFAKVSSLQTSGAAGTAHGAALVSEWSSKQSARRERAVARKRISDLKSEREKLRRQARQRGQALDADTGGNDDQWAEVPDSSDDSSEDGDNRDGQHDDDTWLRATGDHKRPVGGSSTRFTVPVAAEGLASASYATLQGSRYGQERQTFAVAPMMALSAAGQAAKPTTMVGGSLMVSLPPSRLRSAGSLPHLIMGSATALPLPLPPPPPRGMPPPAAVDRAPMPLLEISDSMDHARAHHVSALRRLAQTTGLDGTGRQGKGALPVSARGVGARAGAPLGGSKGSLYRRARTPPGRWAGHRTAGPLSGGMVGSFALGANLKGGKGGIFPPGSPILSHAAIESKSPGNTPADHQNRDVSSPPRHVPDAETFEAARQEVLARAAASTSGGSVVFARPVPRTGGGEGGGTAHSLRSVLSEDSLAAHNVQSVHVHAVQESAAGVGTQHEHPSPAVSFSASSMALRDRNSKKTHSRAAQLPTSPGSSSVPAVANHSAFLPRALRETVTSVEAGHSPLGAEVTINTVSLSPFSKMDKGGPVHKRGGSVKSVPALPLHGRLLTALTSTAMSRALYYHETGGGEGGDAAGGMLGLEAIGHQRAGSARCSTAGSDARYRPHSSASSTGVVQGVAGGAPAVVGTTRAVHPSPGRLGGSVRVGQQDAISALEAALRNEAPKLGMDRYTQLGARRRAAAEQGGATGTHLSGRGSASARDFSSTAPAGMQGSASARGGGKSVFVSAGSRLLSKEALGTGFAGGGSVGMLAYGGRAAVHDTTRDEYEDVTWQQASGREDPAPRTSRPAGGDEAGEGGYHQESLPFAPSLVDAANANRGVGVGGGNARRMIGRGGPTARDHGPIPAWMQLMAASGHKQRVLRDITVAEAAGIERGSGEDPLITQSGVAARAVVIQREKEAKRHALAMRNAAANGGGVSLSRGSTSRGGSRDDGDMTPVVPSEAGGIIAAGAATRPGWEDTSRPWRQGAEIEARVQAAVHAQSKPGPRAPTATSVRPDTSEHAKRGGSSGLSGRTQELYAAVKLDGSTVTVTDNLKAAAANAKAPSAPGAGLGKTGRTARVAVLRGRGRTLRVSGASNFGLPGDALQTAPATETKAEHGPQLQPQYDELSDTIRFQAADLHSGGSFQGGGESNATPPEYANDFATRIVASAARPAWSVASLGSLGSLASRAAEEATVKAEQAQRDEELAAIVASSKTPQGGRGRRGGALVISHLGLSTRSGSPLNASPRGSTSARTLSARGLGGSFATMPGRGGGAQGGSAQALSRADSPANANRHENSSAFMASMPEHAFSDWTSTNVKPALVGVPAVAGSGAEAAAQLKSKAEHQPEQVQEWKTSSSLDHQAEREEPIATANTAEQDATPLPGLPAAPNAEHQAEHSDDKNVGLDETQQGKQAEEAEHHTRVLEPEVLAPAPSPDAAAMAESAELRPVTADSSIDMPPGDTVKQITEVTSKDAAAATATATASKGPEATVAPTADMPRPRPGFVTGASMLPPPSRNHATAQLGVAQAISAPVQGFVAQGGPPGKVQGLVLGLPALAPPSQPQPPHATAAATGSKLTRAAIQEKFRRAALAAIVGVGGFGAPADPPRGSAAVDETAVREGTGLYRPKRCLSSSSSEHVVGDRTVTGDSAIGAGDFFGDTPDSTNGGSPTHSLKSRVSRGSIGSTSSKNRQRSRTLALHARGNSTKYSIAEERADLAAVPMLPPSRVNGRQVSDDFDADGAGASATQFRRTASLTGSPIHRGMGRRTMSTGGSPAHSAGGATISLSPAAIMPGHDGAGGVSPSRVEAASPVRRGTHGDDDIFSVLSDEEGGAGGLGESGGGRHSPLPVVTPLRVDTGAFRTPTAPPADGTPGRQSRQSTPDSGGDFTSPAGIAMADGRESRES